MAIGVFAVCVAAQFDNSLGRLTAASVHNPRKVIDLRRDSSLDKDDVKGREMKRFKQLLIDVETVSGYQTTPDRR